MTAPGSTARPRNRRPRMMYWVTQVVSWGAYVGLFAFWNYISGSAMTGMAGLVLLVMTVGIAASHRFRAIILNKGWLERGVEHVLPRLALWAMLIALATYVVHAGLHDLLLRDFRPMLTLPALDQLSRVINWTVLLLIWAIGYFAYAYVIRHRREEIRILRLETANRESQLNNLRSQLNPHFMFNALNGIRALIDEDPEQAKRAITQLSAILRNAMSSVKRRTVPLGEEIDIVKAYLALEAMRYEERLRTRFEVEPGLDREPVPPMMLQTLVENAVRHGIAHLTGGGDLIIGAHREAEGLVLVVKNSGTYAPDAPARTDTPRNGIGLRNTRKRLEMIYGGRARITIGNKDGMVVTEVMLPADGTGTNERE